MNVNVTGRQRWSMTCTVYSLAVDVLAAVLDGRCALRLKSVPKLCKYNQFSLNEGTMWNVLRPNFTPEKNHH